eukprot:3345093-Rhodomonas_salina.4
MSCCGHSLWNTCATAPAHRRQRQHLPLTQQEPHRSADTQATQLQMQTQQPSNPFCAVHLRPEGAVAGLQRRAELNSAGRQRHPQRQTARRRTR